MAEPDKNPDAVASGCAKDPEGFLRDCTATVGQVENCMTDMFNMARKFVADIPDCSHLTYDSMVALSNKWSGVSLYPPSCIAIQGVCPEIAGSGGGISGASGGSISESDGRNRP